MATEPVTQIVLTTDQLQAILAKVGGTPRTIEDEMRLIQAQADANAEANRKALRPENAQHPDISVFSRAGGELKNPKGEFKYRLTWAGSEVEKDAVTAEEFDLLNQLSIGEFVCTRPDGSKFPVTITGTKHPTTGLVDKLDVFFATRGQLRHGLPSLVVMCRELIAQAKSSVKVA